MNLMNTGLLFWKDNLSLLFSAVFFNKLIKHNVIYI